MRVARDHGGTAWGVVFAYDRLATGRALGEYDSHSLMHYPPIGYSRNGQATIERSPRSATATNTAGCTDPGLRRGAQRGVAGPWS
jgi:hypothetical protein